MPSLVPPQAGKDREGVKLEGIIKNLLLLGRKRNSPRYESKDHNNQRREDKGKPGQEHGHGHGQRSDAS